ncbi:MAG: HD domain-containing protein [Gammaproteobacteria bacterium]|nr:HD domain-containing protein [Gammaproteobacteria bacterium]
MINNLFRFEQHFRILLGLALVSYAAFSGLWILTPIGVIITFTGSIHFCPIYHLLGINSHKSKRNSILAQLPKHNPEPVFIFNDEGDLTFRNDAAKTILPSLTSLSDLQDKNETTQFTSLNKTTVKGFEENKTTVKGFEENGKSYLLHYKKITESNSIVAYGFNVTDLININEEIISTQKELLYRMGEIGETRSKETGNHVKRVAKYSKLLATLYGLDHEQTHLLKMASPMHDIGKVAIPDDILLKPGKLDSKEWVVMQTHASIGYELLKNSERPILKAAAIVAGQHHEKWNGKGYPNRLSGEDIHIFGRITALADVYDALASDRVYKKAWPLDKVIQLITDEKGEHFEPKLVELFLEHQEKFNEIRLQYQD